VGRNKSLTREPLGENKAKKSAVVAINEVSMKQIWIINSGFGLFKPDFHKIRKRLTRASSHHQRQTLN
jgi:hypothetical protein